jgi:hypothetical protein
MLVSASKKTAPGVRALALGHRDAFKLALSAHVGLECAEDRQHPEEHAPEA